MGLVPKPFGNFQCVDIQVFPPRCFIAGLMQLTMMAAAQGHGELVADFKAQGPGLGKAQMMRIARLASANEAGLGGDVSQMGLVPATFGFG